MSKKNSLPLADDSLYGFLYSMFEEIFDNEQLIEELKTTKNIMTLEDQRKVPNHIKETILLNLSYEQKIKKLLKMRCK